MRVIFENNIWVEMSQERLDLHIKMQEVYNDIGKTRDQFAEIFKEKLEKHSYYPYLIEQDQEEYRLFLKSLEPRLDFCFKYDQISLLPPLAVKIKEIKGK